MLIGTFASFEQARFWHAGRWSNQGSDCGVCRMIIRSQAFVREPPCVACSVIPMYGSCASYGAQKNGLRLLRAGPERRGNPHRSNRTEPFARRNSIDKRLRQAGPFCGHGCARDQCRRFCQRCNDSVTLATHGEGVKIAWSQVYDPQRRDHHHQEG